MGEPSPPGESRAIALRRLAADFPWPAEIAPVDLTPFPCGWLADGAATLLARELSSGTALVLELGAWLGLSTRHIADHAPRATVVTVDTWLGSPEHQTAPAWIPLLPNLYAAFLKACWPYRDRIIPLKMDSLEGIATVARYGLTPSLAYIDADHSYDAVLAEIALCHRCFPEATLVGDDYAAPGVRRAVTEFAERSGFAVEVVGAWPAWKLGPQR